MWSRSQKIDVNLWRHTAGENLFLLKVRALWLDVSDVVRFLCMDNIAMQSVKYAFWELWLQSPRVLQIVVCTRQKLFQWMSDPLTGQMFAKTLCSILLGEWCTFDWTVLADTSYVSVASETCLVVLHDHFGLLLTVCIVVCHLPWFT